MDCGIIGSDTDKIRINALSYGQSRFFHPRLNFKTFQSLDADPSDHSAYGNYDLVRRIVTDCYL